MDRTLRKVTGFVTRGEGDTAELLVFRHPNAGVQLPAGTVEAGETPAAAVLREVLEETGISAQGPALLTCERTALTGNARALVATARLRAGPSPGAAELGVSLPRGRPCRLLTTVGGSAEVMVEERDLGTGEILQRYTGWIDEDALATSVERSHFHLTTVQRTGSRWNHRAEERFHFECFWVPLRADPGLVEPQQSWFGQCLPSLRAATREQG